jgi:hypothetical protein
MLISSTKFQLDRFLSNQVREMRSANNVAFSKYQYQCLGVGFELFAYSGFISQ